MHRRRSARFPDPCCGTARRRRSTVLSSLSVARTGVFDADRRPTPSFGRLLHRSGRASHAPQARARNPSPSRANGDEGIPRTRIRCGSRVSAWPGPADGGPVHEAGQARESPGPQRTTGSSTRLAKRASHPVRGGRRHRAFHVEPAPTPADPGTSPGSVTAMIGGQSRSMMTRRAGSRPWLRLETPS
jgi:hypothetical protein